MRTKEPNVSTKGSSLHSLFLNELKDIYWAEQHLVKNLPKVAKAASSSELKEAIEGHLEETKEHVSRCERVFEIIEEKADTTKCEAMDGLVKETERVIKETDGDTMVRDAAIISCAQKVEHYEIATYGTLCTFAKVMGLSEVEDILSATLEEERGADDKLTEIAENFVNEGAEEEE